MKRQSKPMKAAAFVFIFLGCVLASLSVAAVWLHEIVADTETYVETVAPLSEDPAIKDAVATYVTNELVRSVDFEKLVQESLPEQARFQTDPIEGMLSGFLYEQVRGLLDTPVFSALWKEANRQAHVTVTQIITGEGDTIYATEGKINLNLGKLVDDVNNKLIDRGIFIFQNLSLEGSANEFIVFDSPGITKVQKGVEILNRLAFWLPPLALLLWIGGVWMSNSRGRAIFWAALGLALGLMLMQVGLRMARGAYLSAIEAQGSVDIAAATSFFDIIIRSLKTSLEIAFGAGLVIAAGAFLAGPWRFSTKVRSGIKKLKPT